METTSSTEQLIGPPVAPMHREPDSLSEQVSQALLGMRVRVLESREGWRRVETPDGYSGWLAADALASFPEGWGEPWAEATDLWANLRARNNFRLAAVTQAVIGTRLPLLDESDGWTELLLPDGRRLWTESRRVHRLDGTPLRPAAGRTICATARRFRGVPYLWGGCSPLGLDCSGFVQLVLRLHGVHLMRDADLQATQGRPSDNPDTADLVFFGPEERPEKITHVGMMLDRQRFIHASGGDCVRINRLTDAPYPRQLRFARRYLPAAAPPPSAPDAAPRYTEEDSA